MRVSTWLREWWDSHVSRSNQENVFVEVPCQSKQVDELFGKPHSWMIGKALKLDDIPEKGQTFSIPGVGERRVADRIDYQDENSLKCILICEGDPLGFNEYVDLVINQGWRRL